jgi:hypothetical protein
MISLVKLIEIVVASTTKLFHSSCISPEIILKEGLSRKSKGFTIEGEEFFRAGWYPNDVIFMSKEINTGTIGRKYITKYVYEVNVAGLEYFPDYPSLIDTNAIWEENKLWWEKDEEVPQSLLKYAKNGEISKKKFGRISFVDLLSATGTIVIKGPIESNRIKLFKTEDK